MDRNADTVSEILRMKCTETKEDITEILFFVL